MPQYLRPGVYMEEVDRGAKPIEGVATAVAAFIGFAQIGPHNQPEYIANWTQFTEKFGGFIDGGYLARAVHGYMNNGGTGCYVTRLVASTKDSNTKDREAGLQTGSQPVKPLLKVTIKDLSQPVEVTLAPADQDDKSAGTHPEPESADDKSTETPLQVSITASDPTYRFTLAIGEGALKSRNIKFKNWDELKQALELLNSETDEYTLSVTADSSVNVRMLLPDGVSGEKPEFHLTHSHDKGEEDVIQFVGKDEQQIGIGESAIDYAFEIDITAGKEEPIHHPLIFSTVQELSDQLQQVNAKIRKWGLTFSLPDGETHIEDYEKLKDVEQGEITDDSASFLNKNNQIVLYLKRSAPSDEVHLPSTDSTSSPKWTLNVVVGLNTSGKSSTADSAAKRNGEADKSHSMDSLSREQVAQIRSKFVELEWIGADSPRDVNQTYSYEPAHINNELAIDITDESKVMQAFTDAIDALRKIDEVTILCIPDLMAAALKTKGIGDQEIATVQKAMLEHCETMKDRFAILDAPFKDSGPQVINNWRREKLGSNAYGALYYPWIRDETQTPIPPCGHIAGIYARSDNERGVHKAPANERIRGASDVTLRLDDAEQNLLNPNGINCIRAFPGRGVLVWGARTLAKDDASWRYINVRRLFNYVEESIEDATQWVVFEPNDETLWGKVIRDVTAFLTGVWRSGALFGSTPQQAFYVRCDAELNPQDVRDRGQLIIEIGLAPVKPAEFVVFRISQMASGNS